MSDSFRCNAIASLSFGSLFQLPWHLGNSSHFLITVAITISIVVMTMIMTTYSSKCDIKPGQFYTLAMFSWILPFVTLGVLGRSESEKFCLGKASNWFTSVLSQFEKKLYILGKYGQPSYSHQTLNNFHIQNESQRQRQIQRQ